MMPKKIILEQVCKKCNSTIFYNEDSHYKNCKKCGNSYVNFKAILNHKPTTKIIVTEVNKPNLDRMAEAFYQLLRK
jgi:hypothetical protein